MNMANHTTTSWGAGAPSTKQGLLNEKTHFNGFRYIKGSIMLKIDKNRGWHLKKSLYTSFHSLYVKQALRPCRSLCSRSVLVLY